MDLQELLGNPEFNQLPIGDRLKVARNFPDFSGLPPKDQGTVLYHSAVAFHPVSDTQNQPEDAGFWSTLGKDVMSIPAGLIHAVSNPGEALANATQARLALRPKAAQALKEGNLSGAAGYGLASVMPFVGPMAAQAGEELGGGQPGQGAAHAAEMLVPAALRIPELRNAVVSDETLGTLGEYLKSKRWMDAKARYQARQAPPPPPPSPDRAVALETGGAYKNTANAPKPVREAATAASAAQQAQATRMGWGDYSALPPDQQAAVDQAIEGARKAVRRPPPMTIAPPVVAPPPAPVEAPPAPSISQPLGKVAPQDRETNLVNMLRANTTRKNLEIGGYFQGKGLTPEAVANMPEAEFNLHVRNVKNANGKPYEPSTGRNYHRTFEQARAEVVKAMQEMQAGPVAPPPPPQ